MTVHATSPPFPRSHHRNQTINRKGAYIISRRPSHGQFERRCCHQAILRIFFWSNIYI
jgi:hypothetical protein